MDELNRLIFGKDETTNIVSIEVKDSQVEIFTETNGVVKSEFRDNTFWLITHDKHNIHQVALEGDLYYKYIRYYDNAREWYNARNTLRKHNVDFFSISDLKESYMLLNGVTYYKGMKVNDVSVLSWDIETTGLTHDENSKVLLISNTYRSQGMLKRRLFSIDEYSTQAEMLEAWCDFVRETNPSIILGHNIFMYDFPYIQHVADMYGVTLDLGRDGSKLRFNNYTSKFRKDGSQDYEFTRCFIYGREIVDTMFVAYHFDFARRYESYGLKQIIKQEGLEIKGRQFYDAGLIYKNWENLEERKKIKLYAEHDADDSLALYDLMVASYFYATQSVPKSFQTVNYSATGSQINSLLVRSYLQNGQSIPKANDVIGFEGGISMGNPGRYTNVYKVDVASLYPSIILQYQVYDYKKDPNASFYKMVEYFTKQRLEDKKKAKETGDRYYKELEQSRKIFINSSYGLLGAMGLNFNSPLNAATVTRRGREILQTTIDWAKENQFTLVNADTDSISISYNGEPLSKEDRVEILRCINSLYPEKIHFEDDGYYKVLLVLAAKNYALLTEDDKLKIKGSALKSSKTERALKEFMLEVINSLIAGNAEQTKEIYNKYIKECYKVQDITRWASRKTITEAVLTSKRANETKVLDAVKGLDIQMGNKFCLYFKKDATLSVQEKWDVNNPDHDPIKLTKKVHNIVYIFEDVLDVEMFPKYHLKNKKIKAELEQLLAC